MDRQRLYRLIAAGLLELAGIVMIVAPLVLNAPNADGLDAGILSVLMGVGVGFGQLRTVALVWSAIGLGASVIWAVLALGGFGVGTPWWDDAIEAVVLTATFAGALIALVLARRAIPTLTG